MSILTDIIMRDRLGAFRMEDILWVLPKPTERIGIDINDEDYSLSDLQKEFLLDCANLDFKLGGYNSPADILHELGVTVRICPGIVMSDKTEYLNGILVYWNKKLSEETDSEIKKRIEKRLRDIGEEIQYSTGYYLRGRYLPDEKVIELYPEEMIEEMKDKGPRKVITAQPEYPDCYVCGVGGDDCFPWELMITTLAHETMHAYFDRPGRAGFPYAYFVEEPLAEFGMLLWVDEVEKDSRKGLTGWAYDDVKNKKSWYKYGATLYDQYQSGDINLRVYLENYKCGIDEYEIPEVTGSTSTTSTTSTTLAVTLPSPSGRHASSRAKYEIIEKSSGTVIATGLSMRRTPLALLKHCCLIDKSMTFIKLRKIFYEVHPHYLLHMLITELKEDIEADKATRSDKTLRYYEADPIYLASGVTIYVTNQWDKDNFNKFKDIAKELGYDINLV